MGDEVHVVAHDPVDVGRPQAGVGDGGAAGRTASVRSLTPESLRERRVPMPVMAQRSRCPSWNSDRQRSGYVGDRPGRQCRIVRPVGIDDRTEYPGHVVAGAEQLGSSPPDGQANSRPAPGRRSGWACPRARRRRRRRPEALRRQRGLDRGTVAAASSGQHAGRCGDLARRERLAHRDRARINARLLGGEILQEAVAEGLLHPHVQVDLDRRKRLDEPDAAAGQLRVEQLRQVREPVWHQLGVQPSTTGTPPTTK